MKTDPKAEISEKTTLFDHEQNEKEIKELLFAVEKLTYPTVVFITTDSKATQAEVYERIKDEVAYDHHQVDVAGYRVEKSFVRYLRERLPESVSTSETIDAMIHIFGLEETIISERNMLAEINFERELIFRDFRAAIVFWVDKTTTYRLQKEAGDFWDWVTNEFHFQNAYAKLTSSSSDFDGPIEQPGYLPEREERIRELETYLINMPNPDGVEDAEDHYREKVRLYKMLAEEYRQVRRFPDAEKVLKRALGALSHIKFTSFEESELRFLLGGVYFNSGHYTDALEEYQKSLQYSEEKKKGYVHHQLGMVYEKQRDWPKAEDHYRKALSFKNKEKKYFAIGNTYHQLGRIFEEQKEWELAISEFERALQWKKKTDQLHLLGSTYHHLGRIFEEVQKWEKAKTQYRKAIKFKSDTDQLHLLGTSHHQLGNVLLQQGYLDTAEIEYLCSIDWFKKTGQLQYLGGTYHQLGRLRQEQKEAKKAESCYNLAIQWHEKTGQTQFLSKSYQQRGTLYQEQGNFKKAITDYTQALILARKTGQFHELSLSHHQLGRLFLEEGELKKSEQEFRSALKLNEKSGLDHQNWMTLGSLGELYEKQERFEDALKFYTNALESLYSYQKSERQTLLNYIHNLNKILTPATRRKAEAILNLHKNLLDPEESDNT